MNTLFRRRLGLLALGFSLPVVAWEWRSRAMRPDSDAMLGPNPPLRWDGDGRGRFPGLNRSASPSMARISRPTTPIKVSGPPVFGMETIRLRRLGPVYSQNRWIDADCEVDSRIRIRNVVVSQPDFLPIRDFSQPFDTQEMRESMMSRLRQRQENSLVWTLRRADGAKIEAISDEMSGNPLNNFRRNDVSFVDQEMRVPGLNYLVQTRFDLDRVSPSRGVLTLETDFKVPDGEVVPLKFEVRPAWFGRQARTLRLESLGWRAPEGGDEGAMVVRVRELGAPLMLKDEAEGSQISWQIALDAKRNRAREIISERKLLHNWSPRVESADGKFNSHAARDAKVWSSYNKALEARKSGATPVPVPTFLAGFWPKIWAQAPMREGALITLRYRFYGLNQLESRPVFKAEIGVPGDGFLKISAPLLGGETP